MEHEFWYEGRRPIARLPLEQQAFGSWLSDEISADLTLINTLLTNVELLLDGELQEYRWQGKEALLLLNREEAEVVANALLQNQQQHDELQPDDPDLDWHDSDMSSGCGLEDFHELLLDWKAFVAS